MVDKSDKSGFCDEDRLTIKKNFVYLQKNSCQNSSAAMASGKESSERQKRELYFARELINCVARWDSLKYNCVFIWSYFDKTVVYPVSQNYFIL